MPGLIPPIFSQNQHMENTPLSWKPGMEWNQYSSQPTSGHICFSLHTRQAEKQEMQWHACSTLFSSTWTLLDTPGHYDRVTFLDFSSALNSIHIPSPHICCIQTFLRDRSQAVRLGTTLNHLPSSPTLEFYIFCQTITQSQPPRDNSTWPLPPPSFIPSAHLPSWLWRIGQEGTVALSVVDFFYLPAVSLCFVCNFLHVYMWNIETWAWQQISPCNIKVSFWCINEYTPMVQWSNTIACSGHKDEGFFIEHHYL